MLGINSNIGNMRAQDALATTQKTIQTSLERLSTGVRVNRAEDDAAGLMLRDRFSAQQGGLEEAIRNIQTAQGMVQVAEEGLNGITDALQQMRQLAIRAADDNLSDHDRGDVQQQVTMLLKEINDRTDKTRYNGHRLLDGSISKATDERQAAAAVKSNATLRNGSSLIDIDLGESAYARQFGAVCQGSYEVKLVYSNRRSTASRNTLLQGSLNNTGAGSASIRQTVYDRDGNAHTATISLQESGTANVWDYRVLIDAGGVFEDGVSAAGSVRFKSSTGAGAPLDTGQMIRNSLTLSSATGVHEGDNRTFLDFDTGSLTLAIRDGTSTGQSYTIDFSAISENQQAIPAVPGGVLPAVATNGDAGAQTGRVDMGGTLLVGEAVGNSTSTAAAGWIDRLGRTHNVSLTFEKLAEGDGINFGDTWKYTVNDVGQAGVWTGADGHRTGILQFHSGALGVQSVNGAAGGTATLKLGDGTAGGQEVVLDFSGLLIGGANAATQSADGTAVLQGATTTADFLGASAALTSGMGPTTFRLGPVVDRTGATAVSGAAITFMQEGDSNTWRYSITAPSDSGFTGRVFSGGSGKVTFQDDGDLIRDDPVNPVNFMVKFDDGTAEGQAVTFTLDDATGTGLKMIRGNDLRPTETDGLMKSDGPMVDAVIYWTDGGNAPVIVSTLEGVSMGAKAYSAGGIVLTVNNVSRYDVGLVAYAKTLTYVSATTEDKALQFQVSSDQGEVFRVGIERMTVDHLFRRDWYQGEDQDGEVGEYDVTMGGSISVATTLQAQDLISQIDEALQIVGRANVDVGSFKNSFDRTLEIQRSNHTQITSAFACINDADMAVEATNQSKRMVLMQSATAMVAQANTTSQFVLQLLR